MGGGDGGDSIQMLMKADFTAMLCHLTITVRNLLYHLSFCNISETRISGEIQ